MATEEFVITSNAEELIKILNQIIPSVTGNIVKDALKDGAKEINKEAKAKLNLSKKNKSTSNYKFYSTAFKYEAIRNKNPLELGVKLGVKDYKNGYKLRWLEWGTADRYTKGKNQKPIMSRGSIKGVGFFYSTVKNNLEEVNKIVTNAIIESLNKLAK